jgi:hypothetical protein
MLIGTNIEKYQAINPITKSPIRQIMGKDNSGKSVNPGLNIFATKAPQAKQIIVI